VRIRIHKKDQTDSIGIDLGDFFFNRLAGRTSYGYNDYEATTEAKLNRVSAALGRLIALLVEKGIITFQPDAISVVDLDESDLRGYEIRIEE